MLDSHSPRRTSRVMPVKVVVSDKRKQPKWNATCDACQAVLAYRKSDARRVAATNGGDDEGRGELDDDEKPTYVITCPRCQHELVVGCNIRYRL